MLASVYIYGLMFLYQLLAAFIISFVAVMSVVGSRGFLPINFGTPGLVHVLFLSSNLFLPHVTLATMFFFSPPNWDWRYNWSSEEYVVRMAIDLLSQVGLALSYAAPMVSLLGSFLTSFTETEKEMVSIERTLQVWIWVEDIFLFISFHTTLTFCKFL